MAEIRRAALVTGSATGIGAAVVIGLADFVDANWHGAWAQRFVTATLGSVVIFEICGPLLVKWLVKGAGEVRAVTLLRRTTTSATGNASIWKSGSDNPLPVASEKVFLCSGHATFASPF